MPVSRIVSPRPSCSSPDESGTATAPSCAIPTANDTRVLVEGFSNTSPIARPARSG